MSIKIQGHGYIISPTPAPPGGFIQHKLLGMHDPKIVFFKSVISTL